TPASQRANPVEMTIDFSAVRVVMARPSVLPAQAESECYIATEPGAGSFKGPVAGRAGGAGPPLHRRANLTGLINYSTLYHPRVCPAAAESGNVRFCPPRKRCSPAEWHKMAHFGTSRKDVFRPAAAA